MKAQSIPAGSQQEAGNNAILKVVYTVSMEAQRYFRRIFLTNCGLYSEKQLKSRQVSDNLEIFL